MSSNKSVELRNCFEMFLKILFIPDARLCCVIALYLKIKNKKTFSNNDCGCRHSIKTTQQ